MKMPGDFVSPGERILRRKKQIVTPGEMEEVILERKTLEELGWPEEVWIAVEPAETAGR